MKNYYKPCPYCKWYGKIKLSIWKGARRRYHRKFQQFKQWVPWAKKPKELKAHIDKCRKCDGIGLVRSESFPDLNLNAYPNIAIIGWWIGWVALAVACLHRWIPYTLYERDSSFNSRSQGYGLTLQQASKAIEWLWISSLEDGLTSTRHVVHNVEGEIIWEWGRRKLDLTEIEKPTKRRNIHIARQSLRAELLDQLQDNSNIKWDHCLKKISEASEWWYELEFQLDGQTIKSQADLVVGADGIRSTVRSFMLSDIDEWLSYLGCIVILWICPLERVSDLSSGLLDWATVFQTVNGNDRMYMMPYDRKSIMWQFSFPIDEAEAIALSKKWAEALKTETIRRIWKWHNPITDILIATKQEQISGYPVYDRKMLEPDFFQKLWDITLIWDAMHPMSPFKWQWANQAILDALNLARDIASKCISHPDWKQNWLRKTLLNDFEKEMLERSSLKVRDSASAVELLHSTAVLHDSDIPRGRGIDI